MADNMAEADWFRSGDIVKLKSSEVLMTVESYSPENFGYATCIWFDNKDRLKRDIFKIDNLISAVY